MNQPEIYPICSIDDGEIIMMPKPNDDSLTEDMQFYANQGITHIISLLREPEAEKLNLQNEGTEAQKQGIEFIHFPVKDMDVPDETTLRTFIDTHLPVIQQGAKYAIHCHGGRGRAGTVAISFMLKAGFPLEDALRIAREKRQDPMVPVCSIQDDFLKNYAETL
jgi:protein-tyrosine phosphatase